MNYEAIKWHGGNKWILLTESSQPYKTTYYMIPTVWHSGKGKIMEIVKKKISGHQGLGGQGGMSRWSSEHF